jgi:hypothetical protein
MSMTFWCRGVRQGARARHQPGRLVPSSRPARGPGGTPSSASSPVPLTRMIWLKRKLRATPAARNHRVRRMLRVNGAAGAGEEGWRGGAGRPSGGEGTAGPGRQSPAARPAHPAPRPRAAASRALLPGPMCHEPRTRRRTRHIRRFGHICAVDPGFVVDRVPAPTINRRTRIHHGNRRTPPPDVTPGRTVTAVTAVTSSGRPELS